MKERELKLVTNDINSEVGFAEFTCYSCESRNINHQVYFDRNILLESGILDVQCDACGSYHKVEYDKSSGCFFIQPLPVILKFI